MTTLEIAAQINLRLPELMRDGSENRIQSIAGIIDAMLKMGEETVDEKSPS